MNWPTITLRGWKLALFNLFWIIVVWAIAAGHHFSDVWLSLALIVSALYLAAWTVYVVRFRRHS